MRRAVPLPDRGLAVYESIVGQTSNVDPGEIHVLLSRTELARLVDLTQQPHDAELHDRLAAILRQFSR